MLDQPTHRNPDPDASVPDDLLPLDPTGPLTVGTIPDADLNRLFDATVPPIERLRSAVLATDPAMLKAPDFKALIGLISAALESDSEWANHVRAEDEGRFPGSNAANLLTVRSDLPDRHAEVIGRARAELSNIDIALMLLSDVIRDGQEPTEAMRHFIGIRNAVDKELSAASKLITGEVLGWDFAEQCYPNAPTYRDGADQ